MAFSRAAALRACFRSARPSFARPQLSRQIARRGYASQGHDSAKAGGDTLWAAGAVAVTVPACWYLIANGPDTSHHESHGDHDSHNEEHEEDSTEEESKEEESTEEASKEEESTTADEPEEKSDDESEKADDSEEDKKDDETPETSDDEGVVGEDDNNVKKRVPDAKGGYKKRSESEKGIKLNEKGDETNEGDKDEAAAAKPASKSKGKQSGKQEGLSNTDTKHSVDISEHSEKSSKADGQPETAKAKGTVDPGREVK